MKYIVVLGDGMADEPVPELGGRTPLEYADTPAMDRLAGESEIGLVHTIPEGMAPGSDTANLAVLGYDPAKYYSGRSPLEALSIGVPMKEGDIAVRCNIVTLSEGDMPFEERTLLDHSSGEIGTEECAVLLEAVKKELQSREFTFYTGTSYRHCLIWDGGKTVPLTPPHDILGKAVGPYLPAEPALRDMMEKSFRILEKHPVNLARKRQGLNPANCCWFWGAGTKPLLDSFEEKTGKRGAMISAVDLLKGIATGAGMRVVRVEGATGGLETNYEGKMQAAVRTLCEDGDDFVYIHVEAPDEMGHQGSAAKKVKAVEYLDRRLIGPLCRALDECGMEYRLLILPDHPTPVRLRTHTADSVPYLLFDSTDRKKHTWKYNEREAAQGSAVPEGHRLIEKLLEK